MDEDLGGGYLDARCGMAVRCRFHVYCLVGYLFAVKPAAAIE